MKTYSIILCLMVMCSLGFAQIKTPPQAPGQKAPAQKAPAQKLSPADSTMVKTNDGVTINIHYSSPSLKGRKIGTEVAEFGKVWRTGANATTTISFDNNVTINGKRLEAGKYGIHTIPGEANTTIIFNKTWDQWGTKYDQKDDALRVDVKNDKLSSSQERMKIMADKSGKVSIAWGTYGASFQVKAAN